MMIIIFILDIGIGLETLFIDMSAVPATSQWDIPILALKARHLHI